MSIDIMLVYDSNNDFSNKLRTKGLAVRIRRVETNIIEMMENKKRENRI
jgi:hypothetical protein